MPPQSFVYFEILFLLNYAVIILFKKKTSHCFLKLKENIFYLSKTKGLSPTIRPGSRQTPVHGRDPTTVRHGNFCLLCHHPGPIRSSLVNLDPLGSPERPILMPSLVRTPDRHRRLWREGSRQQTVLRPGLHVAGLQEYATTPGR